MRLANELLGFRRVLVIGIAATAILSNIWDVTIYGVGAWYLFLLVGLVYLFDVAYHAIKTSDRSKVGTLFWLLWKGLTARHRDMANVKGYYAQEHYDWITDVKFPESILHTRREAAMAHKARQYINNSKVLDLGCGTGLITRVLPGEVYGVDISPWKIDRARLHCPDATFLVDDIEELTVVPKEKIFDVVVFTDVLEHLERPDKAVQSAYNVLKDGGLVIGTVPTRSLIWKMRRFLTTADATGEPFHIYYNVSMIRDLLKPLRVVEVSRQCLGLEWFFTAVKEVESET